MKTIHMTEGAEEASNTEGASRERFEAIWRRCLAVGTPDRAGAVWDAMEARYAEPHRHYHDAQHLAQCFEQLDLARDHIECPDAVELALWFHDVINESGRPDNETRSADFFRDWAGGSMEDGFVATVVGLILATTHQGASSDRDRQFICDIDLASFGCDWECYKRDTDNLKEEFAGSEEQYYERKRQFLASMLSKQRIFQTDFFHDRYEARARDNIRRLLDLVDRRLD